MGLFGFGKKSVPKDSAAVTLVYGHAMPSDVKRDVFIQGAKMVVSDRARIIADCVKLVNSTVEPRVFFERYRALLSNCADMVTLEEYFPFTEPLPSKQLATIEGKKADTIDDFIDRYYEATVLKMLKLKTEKAKAAKIEDFYLTLTFYSGDMEVENVVKFNEIYSRFQPESYT